MRTRDAASDILKIGVIIPSLNEEHNIKATLDSIRGKGVSEVLVVDGGSTDRTVKVAKAHGAKVIKAPRGRGPQQNVGWRASKADWCLFLHADSQLPPNFAQLISHAVRQQEHQQANAQHRCWGCFQSIKLTDVPQWQSWWIELTVALRTVVGRLPYGDQALFVERKALEGVQGFPDWRVLEDLALVRELNKLSKPVIVPCSVMTSGRKYVKLGFWETVMQHQAIMWGWAAGMDHQNLEQLYDACNKGSRAVKQ